MGQLGDLQRHRKETNENRRILIQHPPLPQSIAEINRSSHLTDYLGVVAVVVAVRDPIPPEHLGLVEGRIRLPLHEVNLL